MLNRRSEISEWVKKQTINTLSGFKRQGFPGGGLNCMVVAFILYGYRCARLVADPKNTFMYDGLMYLLGHISGGIGLGLFLILAVLSNIDLIKEKRNNNNRR